MSAFNFSKEDVEKLKDSRFTPRQLLLIVSQREQRKIPMDTLRTWRKRAGVKADSDKCYGFYEVQCLLEFLDFRDRGFTPKQYKAYKRGEFNPAQI